VISRSTVVLTLCFAVRIRRLHQHYCYFLHGRIM
jgi:hypothetical protein